MTSQMLSLSVYWIPQNCVGSEANNRETYMGKSMKKIAQMDEDDDKELL
jgi:hypothetical protein